MKLNNRKTLHSGWIKTESGINITQIRVGDTDSVTNLGAIVEENVSMDKNIAKMSRDVRVSVRHIGMIRKHINQPVAKLLTHALITSRLHTCKSLLHGLTKAQLQRLQRLQNTAARLGTLSTKFTRITPVVYR